MVGVALGCGGKGVEVLVGVTGGKVGEAVAVRVLFSSVRSTAGVTGAQLDIPKAMTRVTGTTVRIHRCVRVVKCMG